MAYIGIVKGPVFRCLMVSKSGLCTKIGHSISERPDMVHFHHFQNITTGLIASLFPLTNRWFS